MHHKKDDFQQKGTQKITKNLKLEKQTKNITNGGKLKLTEKTKQKIVTKYTGTERIRETIFGMTAVL